MIKNKHAQGGIITTVLIILLVLVAIVILWVIFNRTLEKGRLETEARAKLMGLYINIINISDKDYVVKRTAQGETFETTDLVIIKDGVRVTSGYSIVSGSLGGTIILTSNYLNNPLDSVTIKFDSAPKTVEVALIADGIISTSFTSQSSLGYSSGSDSGSYPGSDSYP